METGSAFGLWPIVVINSAIFIMFAFSVFHPTTKRDWRVLGTFSAFVVALFTEMYGFPLTIYLLSGWLGDRFPALALTHGGGHLWNDLIGWKWDPHISPFHLASYVFFIAGFSLISKAWQILWKAQREDDLAIAGPYARVRHPQYVGFILVMGGFLLQWPTLPTLVMFPVLVFVYRRLAIAEEREVTQRFGDLYDEYASLVPRFIPRWRDHARTGAAHLVTPAKGPGAGPSRRQPA